MDRLLALTASAALLGSSLIGGVFFAFSSFIMKALASIPAPQGIVAMQSINVVVLNRTFLAAFLGTTTLSVGVLALTFSNWSQTSSAYFVSGALSYLLGTVLVTGLRSVPLNNELALLDPNGNESQVEWQLYLSRWLRWNHLRTAAAFVAASLFYLGLIKAAGS